MALDTDEVRLVLAGEKVVVAESYSVTSSIFTQPAAFTIRLGHSGVARELIRKFPPGTAFQLFVGEKQQQSGRIDAVAADASDATAITLSGRDILAPLHDGEFEADASYVDATYSSLILAQLDAVGLKDVPLFTTNEGNLKVQTGGLVFPLGRHRTVDEIIAESGSPVQAGAKGTAGGTIRAKLGEKRYQLLRKYFDMAGLFLWASAEGGAVLSSPNADKKPMARLLRRRGETVNAVNVLSASYSNGTAHRHNLYIVYGRTGGRKGGRAKIRGLFEDQEMKSFGIVKTRAVRSKAARTQEQADFIAQRKCAEERRQDWRLTYTVAGHSTIGIGGARVVWAPDGVVDVQDDELGISGPHYLETVTFRRGPQTTTELTLQRPEDLLFGSDEGGG